MPQQMTTTVPANALFEPLHERLRAHARATPNKAAIVWYGHEISFSEIDRLSDACAAVFAGLGVRAGEPVSLYMQNCPQFVIAFLGVQKLGAIVAPCSPLYKPIELQYQLSDLGARVIVAADNLLPVVDAVRDQTRLEHVLLVHYEDLLPSAPTYRIPEEIRTARAIPAPCIDFLAALDTAGLPPARAPAAPDEVALLVYTSGSTGRPKGAMLSYGNALFKTEALATVVGLGADDVHLAIAPLYHIAGMLAGLDLPIWSGATVILHYRFDAVAALESIEHHRATYWKSVAPMLAAAMDLPADRRYDLTSLRLTAGPGYGLRMTEDFSERWAAFAGGCPAIEAGYGLTETHTFDTLMPPSAVRWGTLGRVVPGVECRIVDPASGLDQPPGQQGEVVLRSPGNFLGYWRQPEKTAEVLRDGWVHTADIGMLDADGYLTLLGRMKELIKVSGYSVFPEDVEAILLTHPDVREVAVVGVPDPSKGEVVKAIIVSGGHLDAETLIAWSRNNMAAYKVPRQVEFRDQLPKAPSGKVLRTALRA